MITLFYTIHINAVFLFKWYRPPAFGLKSKIVTIVKVSRITTHCILIANLPRFFSDQYGALKMATTVDPFLFTPKKLNFSENLNKIFI